MNDFLQDLIPTLGILILSGLVQGVLGFGFSIVAITLLPFVLGLRDGVTFMALMGVVAMSLSYVWNRKDFSWKEAKWMVVWGILGVPVGVALLASLEERILIALFGAFLVFVSASHFLRKDRPLRSTSSAAAESGVGFLSGTLAGAFSMGGPPVVAYLYGKDWSLDRIKAFMATVYLATSITRLLFVGVSGENLGWVFRLFLVCVIPVAFVLHKGVILGRRVGVRRMRFLVFAYLGIIGLAYLFGWH